MGISFMKTTLLALCFVGAAALGETKDEPRFYGSCGVHTDYDDFTDAVVTSLICIGTARDTVGYVAIMHSSGTELVPHLVLLNAGVQYQRHDTVDVMYRFDKGSVFRETWEWSDNHNAALDGSEATFSRFIDNMAQAERLIYRIGNKLVTVDLHGVASAVADFGSRVTTSD